MTEPEVVEASRRERALYQALLADYGALLGALADDEAPVDPAWVGEQQAHASATTATLRDVAAALAAHRLSGAPVPPEAEALWRGTADLAAEAAELNARLAALARTRLAETATQLAALETRRRGLVGYRPLDARTAGLASRRV